MGVVAMAIRGLVQSDVVVVKIRCGGSFFLWNEKTTTHAMGCILLLYHPTIQSLSLSNSLSRHFSLFFFISCSCSVAARRMYSQKTVDSINNKPVWLSDIGAYPVIFICGIACVGAFSYIGYKTTTDDIQISANKRGSVIRWWGHAQSHKELVASLK
jgi:hypothetical protein